ncbi:MAG: hypothetical protein Q4D58_02510, partial [Synergistaceae bacterium]|nr:hypothetical protein [Synergistaceae bacterium]
MARGLDVYTGELTYKEIIFSFVFDRKELRLIPPKEKYCDVNMWFMRELGNGTHTLGAPVYVEDDYLVGICNENSQKIIFLPKHLSIVNYHNVLSVVVEAYIIQTHDQEWIDLLGFMSQEIDYIFLTFAVKPRNPRCKLLQS